MRTLVYDPFKTEGIMKIACFVSGSGTNHERIYKRDPDKNYVVCSNVPDCKGVENAIDNWHRVVSLDSKKYFEENFGLGKIPRKGKERNSYDKELCKLMENRIVGKPDLICLAGYDLWIGDWMIKEYNNKILNVHPGDTTKGYTGLAWRPTASAILAGEDAIRSTVFFVDKILHQDIK